MSRRKFVTHGSRRYKKVVKTIPSTGTQAVSISLQDGDMFQFTTSASASTALTIDVTDLYEGAEFMLYVNSLHGSDTLNITANGTADAPLADGSGSQKSNLTVSDQNLIRGYVITDTDGSEILVMDYGIF